MGMYLSLPNFGVKNTVILLGIFALFSLSYLHIIVLCDCLWFAYPKWADSICVCHFEKRGLWLSKYFALAPVFVLNILKTLLASVMYIWVILSAQTQLIHYWLLAC